MILLLGGTSETAQLAEAFAQSGTEVLVSTATETRLDIGRHSEIKRRSGRLDLQAMASLILDQSIEALVDATHPYAQEVSRIAREAASSCRIAYFRYERPPSIGVEARVTFAQNVPEAARIAADSGVSVLLTTGSKSIEPFVKAMEGKDSLLFARVLDEPWSCQAALKAGIHPDRLITARGPFSVRENRSLLKKLGVGLLVTKDGGSRGGTEAKIEAAFAEKCQIVVIRRPQSCRSDLCYDEINELVASVLVHLSPKALS